MDKIVYMESANGEVFETSNPEYHKDCKNLGSGEKGKTARRDYARSELKKLIKPGQTIYCNVASVSKSGMSRVISLYIIMPAKRGEPAYLRNIDSLASAAIGWSLVKNGIRVSGCGMDMAFYLVYTLGAVLWPNGVRTPRGLNDGEQKRSGGYSLKYQLI